MTIFNPLDTFYKSVVGAVRQGEEIIFRVKGNFDSLLLCIHEDGKKDNIYQMLKYDGYFECEKKFDYSGLFFYGFLLSNGDFIGLSDNYEGKVSKDRNYFQLTVFCKDYSVPKWIYGGVIYQIFPDRFFCYHKNKTIDNGRYIHTSTEELPVFSPDKDGKVLNNDFFGGDLKGIEDKLPYIKSLGISIIYLNPIFEAYSNHRYDTGNFMKIDPLLGTEEDFKSLIDSAEKVGIKIILDGVFNHVGDDSIYFNKYDNYKGIGAYQNKNSPYYEWFKFVEYPKKYDSWWGVKTLPATDKNNSNYLNYITGENGVIEHYTKMGIGGWRLDVVDELPENFSENIRNAVKTTNLDAVIIGEVWEDASNKVAYGVRRKYFQGKELDSVMNYPLKNAIIDFVKSGNSNNLSFVIKEQIDHYPTFVLHALMNILSTHDTYRLISALSDNDVSNLSKEQMSKIKISGEELVKAKNRLKMASLIQYTVYGVPSLYYGDEIGMQGYSDPLNRCFYAWGKEDEEILSWYKFLGELRQKYSVFKDGEFKEIFSKNGAFIYKRYDKSQEILIAVNSGDKRFYLEYDGSLYSVLDDKYYKNEYQLLPMSVGVFVKNA